MHEEESPEQIIPPFEMRGSMWAIHHRLLSLPVLRGKALEQRIQLVEEELAVRDLLAKYTYCYDGNDLDGTMSVFHDDCVLINPRGTYVGKEAIRRNYEYLIAQRKFTFHYVTNVAVRLLDDGRQARMTAYHYSVSVSHNGGLAAVGGTYADRLIKVDEQWKIIERRITLNYRHVLSPEPPSSATPPPCPSIAETSGDLIGPGAMM